MGFQEYLNSLLESKKPKYGGPDKHEFEKDEEGNIICVKCGYPKGSIPKQGCPMDITKIGEKD